jgi:CubicO group peptidase (beta-lactamase class C family)
MATPFERWYGVLSKRNVELPFSQRPRIGGGGLYSTATDLANFTIAQINQGKFLRFQLLMPENIDLMHTLESETNGDFLQVGYGYGWGIFRDDPWQMWDMTFKPHGFQGHGGRYLGYSSAMYMVQEEVGGYGYVMLMNTGMTESQDMPWFFSIQFNIQDSLLQEAQRLYQASHNE